MMRQKDLIDAVNTIHVSAQLKDKVLSGKSSRHHKNPTAWTYFKCAECLAIVMILVLGILYVPRVLKPVATVGQSNSASFAASGQTAAVQGIRNILLLGVDSNQKDVGRSDCIMLLSIDNRNESKRLILTPFPRDLYVDIPGHGKNRINGAYMLGGAALSVETIKENFKINIDDYAVIDLPGFTRIIDRLGGVRVDITEREAKLVNQYSGESKKHLAAGSSVLTGQQASYYSRIRSLDGDLQRMQREQAVMSGMINQFKLLDIGSMTKLAQDVLPLVKTNMDKNTVLTLASDAFACRNFPVSYFRPTDDLFQEKQVPVQGGVIDALVPNLDKYNDSLSRFIYQNEAP